MSTSRLGFANALLTAIGAPHGDAVRVVVAWQMQEGQTPGENDPLASINEHDPHGTGGPGNRFSFASIDNALAQSARQLSKGGPYAALGDAFRAGKPADELISAIGRAGWAGGPLNPSPTYAAGVRRNYNSIASQEAFAREGQKIVAVTDITGAPKHYSTDEHITGGDVVKSLPGAGIAKSFGSTAEAVAAFVSKIMDPAFWKRAGVFALGLVLAGWGLIMLGHGMAPNVSAGVKKVAGAAAIV